MDDAQKKEIDAQAAISLRREIEQLRGQPMQEAEARAFIAREVNAILLDKFLKLSALLGIVSIAALLGFFYKAYTSLNEQATELSRQAVTDAIVRNSVLIEKAGDSFNKAYAKAKADAFIADSQVLALQGDIQKSNEQIKVIKDANYDQISKTIKALDSIKEKTPGQILDALTKDYFKLDTIERILKNKVDFDQAVLLSTTETDPNESWKTLTRWQPTLPYTAYIYYGAKDKDVKPEWKTWKIVNAKSSDVGTIPTH